MKASAHKTPNVLWNEGPLLLFDGKCVLCNSSVGFLLKQDRKGLISYASIEDARVLFGDDIKQHGDSLVLIDEGKSYGSSEAALRLVKYLPWYWQSLGILYIVPRGLRDKIYAYISKKRYTWFGRKDRCMIPTKEQAERFPDLKNRTSLKA